MRRLLIALCLLSAMSGCQAVNEAVSNSVSAGQPINQNDQEIALYQSFITPDRIRECLGQPRGSGERQSCRDLITYARLKYADLNYDRFRRKLFETVNGGNTAADLTILGLGSAGALVPGATTKAILAAISAGISGGKGIIDRDLLYNAGIQTLIQKMDGDRGVIRVKITASLKYDEAAYSFEQAELDSADYYQAGTLIDALISLQGQAASQANETSKAINGTVQPSAVGNSAAPVIVTPAPVAPQPAAAPSAPALAPSPVVSIPAPAPHIVTPTPPSPSTTPLAPPIILPAAPLPATPPPAVAAAPMAPMPAPPPAASPAPAPGPTAAPFIPPSPAPSSASMAAADKAALLQALGYDPTTQRFSSYRYKLMKQCWQKLGVSVPASRIGDYTILAQYLPTYRPVANCINQMATK